MINKGLLLSDKQFLFEEITKLIHKKYPDYFSKLDLVFPSNTVDVKQDYEELVLKYDLIISVHCQQIFPKNLVNAIPCINLHPGYNPYNRGWYPHVFSMINKLPTGATLHLMDKYLDHGAIIAQKKVDIKSFDTSKEVYDKIFDLELELFDENFLDIINLSFKTYNPKKGNLNFKKDYYKLLNIDLSKKATYGEVIDYLRAVTHSDYNNAYFIDAEGKKIFVKLCLEVSNE